MSVKLDGTTNWLRRLATTVLDYNSSYTFMGWLWLDNATGYKGIANIFGDINNEDALALNGASPNKFAEEEQEASVYNISAAGTTTAVVSTWYHVALVRSGNDLRIDLGTEAVEDAQEVTATGAPAGRAASVSMVLGAWADQAQLVNGRLYHWAAWQSALTLEQINANRMIWPPTQASPWAYWELAVHTDLTDSSGNARHWTGVGTLATEANPNLAGGPASAHFEFRVPRGR